ncbi:MAG: hypothetical protein HGB12_03015 [Bacteroidetes bacterium]|nr:hypothetical protein [Bacteroidota bacterium]
MKEIWKDIPGYEGFYQISNYGKVKSIKRMCITHNKIKEIKKEILLKLSKDKRGYLVVNLYKNYKPKTFKIHRLVAINFIGNSDLKCVCHKDNNKENNYYGNLYWGTDLENNRQARKDGLFNNDMKIKSIDKYGNIINYESQNEASRKTKISQQNISKCILLQRKTAGGLKWEKI